MTPKFSWAEPIRIQGNPNLKSSFLRFRLRTFSFLDHLIVDYKQTITKL